jgi:3-hydroxybutyryl-CoA dehydrogenase
MGVEKFGVIGAGQMGNGIAQVAAASGLKVLMSDIKQDFCDRGMAAIAKNLDRMVSKGKMEAGEKEAIIGRIETTTDLGDMAGVDFHEPCSRDETCGGHPEHCHRPGNI